jgi:hypothetical protein
LVFLTETVPTVLAVSLKSLLLFLLYLPGISVTVLICLPEIDLAVWMFLTESDLTVLMFLTEIVRRYWSDLQEPISAEEVQGMHDAVMAHLKLIDPGIYIYTKPSRHI